MKSALLIIDVQNIMFRYGGGVYRGKEVLSNIQKLLSKARSESVPVIFIQHTEEEGPFEIGNSERDIHKDIKPEEGELVIPKSSWDSFLNTTLEAELQNLEIEKLVIVGMQTDFCVDTSIRRAYSLGYQNNVVVRDGHSTFDTDVLKGSQIIDHHNLIWGGRFATLKMTDEIEFS